MLSATCLLPRFWAGGAGRRGPACSAVRRTASRWHRTGTDQGQALRWRRPGGRHARVPPRGRQPRPGSCCGIAPQSGRAGRTTSFPRPLAQLETTLPPSRGALWNRPRRPAGSTDQRGDQVRDTHPHPRPARPGLRYSARLMPAAQRRRGLSAPLAT